MKYKYQDNNSENYTIFSLFRCFKIVCLGNYHIYTTAKGDGVVRLFNPRELLGEHCNSFLNLLSYLERNGLNDVRKIEKLVNGVVRVKMLNELLCNKEEMLDLADEIKKYVTENDDLLMVAHQVRTIGDIINTMN